MSKEKENKKKYVIFKMVQILKDYSDREHPMLQKDLVKRLHDIGITFVKDYFCSPLDS